jgi:pilus assembly protein Flp/PilA
MPEPIPETALPQFTNILLTRFVEDESGQDVIEYALVAAMVALGSVSGTANMADTIANSFTGISNTLNSATSTSAPATPTPPAPRGGRRGGNGGGGHHPRFF